MIFVDASRYSSCLNRTGVENYSYYLINEMAQMKPDQITLISPKKVDLKIPQVIIPFPRLWTHIRLSIYIFLNRRVNYLFIPSHVMPIIYPKNVIITIHDVAFKRFPEVYSKVSRWYLDWAARFAVKNAAKIITPSQVTKDDLVQFYQADSEKITVIPLGFNSPLKPNKKEESTLGYYELVPQKYFLFVGRIEAKKNIKTLVRAFRKFLNKDPNYKLVLAGKPGVGYEDILLEMEDIKSNIVLTGYIDDTSKNQLMNHALCFVFPSLFEGFGLPLLEAMSFNLPIIASDIPSSREVIDNHAMFFPVLDENALYDCMSQIAEKEGLRNKLIKGYSEHLKRYSWKRCAEHTWKALVS